MRSAIRTTAAGVAMVALAGAAESASFNLVSSGVLERDARPATAFVGFTGPNGTTGAATRISGVLDATRSDDATTSLPGLYQVEGMVEVGTVLETVSTTAAFALDDAPGAVASLGLPAGLGMFLAAIGDFVITEALTELETDPDDVDTIGPFGPFGPFTIDYAITNITAVDGTAPDLAARFDFELTIREDVVGIFAAGLAAAGSPLPTPPDAFFAEAFELSFSAAPVPLPAALPLLLGGLGALGFASLRRRR